MPSPLPTLLALTVLLWGVLPSRALADADAAPQIVALVGPEPLIGEANETTAEAWQQARTWLKQRGIRVREVERWPDDPACQACREGDEMHCEVRTCLAHVGSEASADDVLAFGFFPQVLETPSSRRAFWVHKGAHSYTSDQPLPVATEVLLDEVLRKRTRGHGPWLIVEGEPVGAHVHLSDKYVGSLPFEKSVRGGLMTLTVSAEGYEPADTTVILQLSAQEEQRYEARLRPLQEVRREKRTRVAGWWLVAAGSAAAGLGAAMLAVNLRQLRQARNCDGQQSSTACTEVQGGDAARRMVGGAAALTVGGLALGATGLTLALRPAAKGSTLLLRKDF